MGIIFFIANTHTQKTLIPAIPSHKLPPPKNFAQFHTHLLTFAFSMNYKQFKIQ